MKNPHCSSDALFLLRSFLICLLSSAALTAQSGSGEEPRASSDVIRSPIKLSVLYDNYPANPALKTDWGFSCLIEGPEKTILFDTGGDGDMLLSNAKLLGADLSQVELIVLSHHHWDHRGGIDEVLGLAPGVPVYVPESAHTDLKAGIEAAGGSAVPVRKPVRLCGGVYSIGEIQGPVNEQSLVLVTKKGLVVITGCSHPGIDRILETVKSQFGDPIHLVFGGFHLLRHNETDLKAVMDKLAGMDVRRWGPTHCTGDAAISKFHDRFGERVEKIGAGRIIEIE
ncbi:MAG: MBL fold metallo-hydrolase [Acidobacteria bacterium]|nr:MBL fold metallo-hydrolase [Acidobacteriota bacterium]